MLENEWQGTRDPAAYLSVPAAIQFQAEHDWPRVRAECHELLREARRRIEEYGRGIAATIPQSINPSLAMPRPYEPICPDSPEWYAQMAAFPLPACDAVSLQLGYKDRDRRQFGAGRHTERGKAHRGDRDHRAAQRSDSV